MISLDQAAEKIVNECMAVKKEDNVLIITDKNKLNIGRAIERAALKVTSTKLIEIPVGKQHGEEPSKDVASLMKLFDVIIIPTTMSLSHTKARRKACEAGVRISTLPKITEEILLRTMEADYNKIKERTDKIADVLDNGKEVEITTDKGTNIKMSIEGRTCLRDTGLMHKKGDFNNLPAGEACLAPIEGTAKGIFVVDASFSGIDKENEEIKIIVDEGYAISIEGGKGAKQLKKMLDKIGSEAYNIAEFGIGTNDKAIISGNSLEDEKVFGSAHIALGNNKTYGGNVDVPIHLDGIFYKPTIKVDGNKIMEKGDLLL